VLLLHSWDLRKARPHRDALGPEFFATPGADDHIGLSLDHLRHRHDTVLGCALISTIDEDVSAAGDLDKFGDPPNPRDQRIVPFLEENLGPPR
jgi:hypothetical protein